MDNFNILLTDRSIEGVKHKEELFLGRFLKVGGRGRGALTVGAVPNVGELDGFIGQLGS